MPSEQHLTPLNVVLRDISAPLLHISLISIFINLLTFIPIFFSLQVLDRVLSTRSEYTLFWLTIGFLWCVLIGSYLRVLRSIALRRVGLRFSNDISHHIYDSSYFQSLKSGRLESLRMFNDLESVKDFATGPSVQHLLDFPWMFIYIALTFIFNIWLGLILSGGVVIVIACVILGNILSRQKTQEAMRYAAMSERIKSSAFKEAETIYAMSMLSGFTKRWVITHKEGAAWLYGSNHSLEFINSFLKFFRTLVTFLLVAVGAGLIMQGELSSGQNLAIMLISGTCIGMGQAVVSRWSGFLRAGQAYSRLQHAFRSYEGKSDRLSLPRPSGHLDVKGLAMTAPGGTRFIISQVSFSLAAGSAMGVIGPSGAGKSTLVRALVGIWPPTHGTVRLDGAELQHWDPDLLGLHLGYLPQNVELLSGSIAENIARFGAIDDAAVLEAATLAGVHDVIQGLPQGYNTQVGEGGSALSGGQRQRIGLARAIYGNPALIVLDEPNSNLDAIGETALAEALKAMKQRGTTCILITHKANILKMVDFVLVLKDGTMSAFGPRDTILAPAGILSLENRLSRHEQSETALR